MDNNEKSNESIISFAFVCAGALGYLLTATILEVLAGTFGTMARVRNIPAVQHGLPVAVGIAVFLFLFMNKKIHTWADECVVEVRKVVWPSRKDTWAMTMVCCVMVVLAGLALGMFDFLASQLIKVFVN
jgi:preprotein translocase subunit SecE